VKNILLKILLSDPYFESGERFGKALVYLALSGLLVYFLIRRNKKKKE
jgi:hypothetical protein